MLRLCLVVAAACWLLASCNEARQDVENSSQGAGRAAGVAEKMQGGSVGAADAEGATDSGE